MNELIIAPLVGSHFRPPAKALLSVLPSGAHLTITREPENSYDEDAVKVLVAPSAIPESQHETLEGLAGGYGFTLEDILGADAIHLGYVANSEKTGGRFASEICRMMDSGDISENPEARLGFGADGNPIVMIARQGEMPR